MKAALLLVSKFPCEMDFTVWIKLRAQLDGLRQLLLERCAPSDECGSEPVTPFEEELNTYVKYLAGPPFKRLGQ